MSGRVLGDRYQIVRQLGRADNRRTLLAEDLQTHQPVVIKLLTFHRAVDPAAIKLFKREAETLRNLSHPSIPQYLDFFDLEAASGNTGLALVQTFIQGRSLEEHLATGHHFSEAEVRQIATHLLSILVYLHGLTPPVVHRDIKPANILIADQADPLNHVFLVDFGAVKTATNQDHTSLTIVGTHGYMPPEQFNGRVTVASDLYSLGMTLITLATHTPIAEIPRRNFRPKFEDLADLSPECVAWLKCLIEPEITNRPASAQVALDRLLNPEPESAHAVEPTIELLRKPAESQIALVKTSTFLEIRVPPMGITSLTLGLIAGVVLINIMIGVWLAMAFANLATGGVEGLLLPLVAGLAAIVLLGITSLIIAGSTHLRLDDHIILAHNVVGYHYPLQKPEIARKVIRLVHYATAPSPYLSLQAGVTQYVIGTNLLIKLADRCKLPLPGLGRFTLDETAWLAQELALWLRLPITHR